MKRKKNDFFEISTFAFVISTIILTSLQVAANFVSYLINTATFPIVSNLKFFFSFEIIFLLLSVILGLIYVNWYFEYTVDSSGKERKRKKIK